MEMYRDFLMTWLNSLTDYDYIGFFITFILFILFLILALILRAKVKLAIFFVLFAFTALLAGPPIIYLYVHKTIYKNEVALGSVKKLIYSPAMVIEGNLTYLGREEASLCTIKANVHKTQGSYFIEEWANQIKAYRRGYCDLNTTFYKGEVYPFKVLIEPYRYEGDFNVTLTAECFR